MGNCEACLSTGSVHDAGEDESVRLVRVTDGQIFEFPGRVLVKDLIFGFDGFAVFHYSTIEHPLPPETELKLNEVYYLRPWTSAEELAEPRDGGKSGSCKKLGCLRSPQQSPIQRDQAKAKKVRFVEYSGQASRGVPSRCEIFGLPDRQQGCDSRQIGEMPTAMELLPQHENGVLRVKLVISKSQLSDLITTTETTSAAMEGIVNPLLSSKNIAAIETTGPLITESSKKPSLDHTLGGREECRYSPSLSSSRTDQAFLER